MNLLMRVLITGGAGCIGSELAGCLLKQGHEVTVFDNLSSGKIEHIKEFMGNEKFKFLEADLLDFKSIKSAVKTKDVVFHLAANSDIKFKKGDGTDEDLKQSILATYNVLEAMRVNGVQKIVFTSSSVIYGEAKRLPTDESYGPLIPISLYAASKLSCESLISAFCHMFDMKGWIFRFANIVGPKSRKIGTTILTDFIERLEKNNAELLILGNGKQSKCYLTTEDCIEGMLTGFNKSSEILNIFNLGPTDAITVDEIAQIVTEEMGLKNVVFRYSGGDRGWLGDVPKFQLDANEIRKLGWKPKYTSKEAIRLTVKKMLETKK